MKRSPGDQIMMVKCLWDESGETLVETLVSILVSSLALIMLATTIGSAVNLILNSRDYMSRYYSGESELLKSTGAPGSPGESLTLDVPLNMEVKDGAAEPVGITVTLHRDTAGTTGIVYYERTRP